MSSTSSKLIISGVIDGPRSGGTPKAVELYALSDIADLSAYGIGSANNGDGTDGEEFTFPSDSATAGDYITISFESPVSMATTPSSSFSTTLWLMCLVRSMWMVLASRGSTRMDGHVELMDRYPAVPPFNLQSGSLVVQMHSILVPLMASVLIHSPSNTLPTPPLKVFHSNHSP